MEYDFVFKIMKTLLILAAANLCIALSLCSCSTAGYATGRTMEKTGHVVEHGGEKIIEHTQ